MLLSAAGDDLSLHSFGRKHSYSAYFSVGIPAVVLMHTAMITKLINSQGFYFRLDSTFEDIHCLNVRTKILSACTDLDVQAIVHCASQSLIFQFSL